MLKVLVVLGVLAMVNQAASAETIKGIGAFHRSGQTFITWQELSNTDYTYNVYRSDRPITVESLTRAQKLVEKLPAGSGADVFAAKKYRTLDITLSGDPVGHDWYANIKDLDPSEHKTQGYVLHTLGHPVEVGTGILVHTTESPGSFYYAVTAVDASGSEDATLVAGENVLKEPVDELVAAPEPILEGNVYAGDQGVVRSYVHWSNDETSWRDGMPLKFHVGLGQDVKDSTPAPLLLYIHSAGGFESLPMPIGGEFITLAPDNYTPGFPHLYDWWYGYNSNLCSGGDLTKGVNVNYTERRLLYLLDWVQKNYNVDPNRIYLAGGSMGGTGSMTFGFRHPEIFAAIQVNVPQTDPNRTSELIADWLNKIWGTREQAIKTNEGINIWERQNMVAYAAEHKEDLPFVKSVNARRDEAMAWGQIPPYIRAMNDSRHGFLATWTDGKHMLRYDKRPTVYRKFDIFKLAKNVSFPAFSNSSINDNPGNGSSEDGDVTGQMGGGFDWKILSDTPREWSAEISVVLSGKKEAVTDITPRRLQNLPRKPGMRYSYTNTDASGAVIQSGEVQADGWGLITLPGMKITSSGNTIKITRR